MFFRVQMAAHTGDFHAGAALIARKMRYALAPAVQTKHPVNHSTGLGCGLHREGDVGQPPLFRGCHLWSPDRRKKLGVPPTKVDALKHGPLCITPR